MNSVKGVALYARVSTGGQTVENQLADLRAVAAQRGWTVAREFVDKGISGTKGRDKRPAFDAMLKAATRGEVDLVAAWSVDRLGRSLQDLVGFLSEIRAAGCDLYLHRQGLDTATPSGKALFGMLGVFAEFEAALIRERVMAGLARAKAEGRRGGRPKAEQADPTKVRTALKLRQGGTGQRKAAKMAGIGVSTLKRIEAERAAAA